MDGMLDSTLNHFHFLAKLFGKGDMHYIVKIILIELGIPTNYDGFEYLTTGILVYFQDPSQMIIKGLYPVVAERSRKQVDGALVESAIRTAIKAGWKHREREAWELYFSGFTKRPSNTEFISRIACMLDLWQGCCEELNRRYVAEEGIV